VVHTIAIVDVGSDENLPRPERSACSGICLSENVSFSGRRSAGKNSDFQSDPSHALLKKMLKKCIFTSSIFLFSKKVALCCFEWEI
jgi:hypothetical protein